MDDDTLQFLADLEREQSFPSNDHLIPPGERPCPICAKKMQVEIEQGIPIDACPEHGVWLDRGELPSIISKIRRGERVNRIQLIREAKAKREGKKSGIILGVWSLLLD